MTLIPYNAQFQRRIFNCLITTYFQHAFKLYNTINRTILILILSSVVGMDRMSTFMVLNVPVGRLDTELTPRNESWRMCRNYLAIRTLAENCSKQDGHEDYTEIQIALEQDL